ncbi:pilin [Marinicella meishanensis]|uniref:pilin n=1 Tax=Marinicella meishanensis TaxID=2873263 RepID=UPI001CBE76D9|nr:pilin [Marinicella sp. NBU2979]
MKALKPCILWSSCCLLTACDSQDAIQGGQVAVATQKAINAYEVRALVIDEIMKASGLKKQLQEHWQQRGDFALKSVSTRTSGQNFNPDSGVITINLSGVSDAFQAGDEITLHPQPSAGYFEWQCRSNVTTNLVPGSCQQ